MVLDPLSAIGLASSVVQFVDFAASLISKGNEYYKSADGVLSENFELTAISERFLRLSRSLAGAKIPEGSGRRTEEELALRLVATECEKLACDFVSVLEELKVEGPHKRWKSFRQALKTIWRKEEIESMLQKLQFFREDLIVHLLVFISNQQVSELSTVVENQKRMEGNLAEVIRQSNVHMKDQVAELSSMLTRTLKYNREQAINQWKLQHQKDVGKISDQVSEAAKRVIKSEWEGRMLESLYFPQIHDRRSEITEAHSKTFNWMFEHSSKIGQPWSDFVDWLQDHPTHEGTYWVTGKAGSGKSTLMKYLYFDVRTKAHLQRWAGDKNLITASCFFWNPGTPIQRSLTGLLKSLLHEILSKRPEYIMEISRWRWGAYQLGASALSPWTTTELLGAFHNVVDKAKESARICFFVDGLDEFEGDDIARGEIIDLFQKISSSSDIKVCLSSRPWVIYQDAFSSCSSLLLQDLTYNDIEHYVHSELGANLRFKKLKRLNEDGCADLVTQIVWKAAGVFLWVVLVVRSLLQGLQNADGILDLQKRLKEIPAGLKEFFRHMMTTLDALYLKQASQLFQIALKAHTPLTIMTYSYVPQEEQDLVLKSEVRALTDSELVERYESTKRRLNSRCKGLLEIPNASLDPTVLDTYARYNGYRYKVRFLHRTAKDFLESQDGQELFNSYSSQDYAADVNVVLVKSFLAQIKSVDRAQPADNSPYDTYDAVQGLLNGLFIYSRTLEDSYGHLLSPVLDEVVRSLSVLFAPVFNNFALQGLERHCTNQVEQPNALRKPLPWPSVDTEAGDTFLTLILEKGLRQYAFEKIKGDSRYLKEKTGRPLLDYILRPTSAYGRIGDIDVKLVQIMLDQGADPNQAWNSTTLWSSFINHLTYQSFWNFLQRDNPHYWIQIIEAFIVHGATKQPFTSHLEQLEAMFGMKNVRRCQNMFPSESHTAGRRKTLSTLRRLLKRK